MKQLSLLILVFCITVIRLHAQTDEESIRLTITSAYIDGIQNRGNSEDIRKGFHPAFAMAKVS